MLSSYLAILLGLYIIYLIFIKGGQKEGFKQKISLPAFELNPQLSTQVYIYNSPCAAECRGDKTQKERRRYYMGYEDVYKKTINRYPGEDIRFDLLTPVPYSDAFAAPMGQPHPNLKPKPTLSQITYPHATYPYQMRK